MIRYRSATLTAILAVVMAASVSAFLAPATASASQVSCSWVGRLGEIDFASGSYTCFGTGAYTYYFYGARDVSRLTNWACILCTPYPQRIWFHQNANGTGWADCFYDQDVSFSPSSRDYHPGNVQISTNTNPC
jgi:hypothetical protein